MQKKEDSLQKKSTNILQHRLKEKLQKRNISVHALEKSAGLKRSAVDNILRGKSKKPSAEILTAICRILGCSIDTLLGNPENINITQKIPQAPVNQSQKPFNNKMYAEAVSVATDTLLQKEIDITETLALQFIYEIYIYSIQGGLNHIDKSFASWLAERWSNYAR